MARFVSICVNQYFPGFPTWQSSNSVASPKRSSARATDGRTSGDFSDGTCTQTDALDFNMWQVDFIDKYEINRVVIHTRADEDADMIDRAQVRLG